jgi:hypothetical protein
VRSTAGDWALLIPISDNDRVCILETTGVSAINEYISKTHSKLAPLVPFLGGSKSKLRYIFDRDFHTSELYLVHSGGEFLQNLSGTKVVEELLYRIDRTENGSVEVNQFGEADKGIRLFPNLTYSQLDSSLREGSVVHVSGTRHVFLGGVTPPAGHPDLVRKLILNNLVLRESSFMSGLLDELLLENRDIMEKYAALDIGRVFIEQRVNGKEERQTKSSAYQPLEGDLTPDELSWLKSLSFDERRDLVAAVTRQILVNEDDLSLWGFSEMRDKLDLACKQ